MLRKALALLLLISHVNFFMFIAQVDESDVYDSTGARINDINSLTEYINDVFLHNKNKSRHDEDDDNARYFHIVKLLDYSFFQQVIKIEPNQCDKEDQRSFPLINAEKPFSVFFDVVTPPPKFIS